MYRAMGCAHATAVAHLDRARRSMLSDDGQGTVEYIGLILLLAAVMAAVAASGKDSGIGEQVVKQVKDAIANVSSGK